MNGNVVSKQVFDGEKGKMQSPMGDQVLEGEALTQMKESAKIFPELTYVKDGVKLKMKGMENVDGKETYKIVVTKPSGTESSVFYGVEDGLKYKEVAQTPQGTVSTTFADYEDVEGILFPMTMKQVMGPQNFDIQIKSVELNTGIEDSRFEVN
jgi:outer membrane lipoprotein-sorting protein